jgi:hypothetical protein
MAEWLAELNASKEGRQWPALSFSRPAPKAVRQYQRQGFCAEMHFARVEDVRLAYGRFLKQFSRVEFELIAAAEDEWFIRCLEC